MVPVPVRSVFVAPCSSTCRMRSWYCFIVIVEQISCDRWNTASIDKYFPCAKLAGSSPLWLKHDRNYPSPIVLCLPACCFSGRRKVHLREVHDRGNAQGCRTFQCPFL